MAKIDISDLSAAIEKELSNYKDFIFEATEEGLDAAEKILINNLKSSSPKDQGAYAKAWKGKGKKYKGRRYVGNTKTVKGKKSDTIPLSNILEYSSKSPHQGKIKKTFDASIDEMINAVLAEIKKGG